MARLKGEKGSNDFKLNKVTSFQLKIVVLEREDDLNNRKLRSDYVILGG